MPMKPTVYIETTIPSYLCSRPSRDLIVAGHQELTHEWWDSRREHYRLWISELVLAEIDRGDPDLAAARRRSLAGVPLLPVTDDARDIGRALVEEGIIPAKAATDAFHIAVATVHAADYLLTWNCTHINNAEIKGRLAAWMAKQGWVLPGICTPEELLESPNEG